MNRLLLCVIFGLTALAATAQDHSSDSLAREFKDSIIVKEKKPLPFNFGIYGDVGGRLIPVMTSYRLASYIGVGCQYEILLMGFSVQTLKGNIYSTLVFPNEYVLRSKQGAAYLGLKVISSKYISSELRLNYGKGDVLWQRTSDSEDFLRDDYNLIEPEVLISAIPVKYIRLVLSVGYRRVADLDIAKLSNQDMSGFTFGATLKFGFYN